MKYAAIVLSLLLPLTVSCTALPPELRDIGTPVIQTFEATPSIIKTGDVTSLRWSTINTQSVSIDNGIGDVAISGTMPVSPNTTTFYTLTAKNPLGTATARTQIIVQTPQSSQPAPATSSTPRILLFVSDRTSIASGEYIVLRWNVLESSSVRLNPIGIVGDSGELRLYLKETTTFTLTASNSAGDSTISQTITVLNPVATQSGREYQLVLNAMPYESGSLIKGNQDYLDYMKRDNACAGDTSSNLASRAFLSFDISSIPANAIIKAAILDLSQYTKTGDPSYSRSLWGNMGALEVYHLQYGRFDDIGLTAYNQAAQLTQNGSFISYPQSSWAWDAKNANDGTPVVQNLVNTRDTRCQFRIQFFTSTNWDSTSDVICFDNATLTITYAVP